jgi:prephenate dehydrogenase
MIVGIVGLGLIGGSFAIELKKLSYIDKIYGVEHNKKHQKEALSLGLVEKIITFNKLNECDLIALAVPTSTVVNMLKELTNIKKEALVIDFGSTKKEISSSIPSKIRKNVLTAHPLAGLETSGPKSATSNLFKNKTMVFCDIKKSGVNQFELATKIFQDIGMKIIHMKADKHDFDTALISHMPHIISFTLANSILKEESPKNILNLAGGGFESMSRLAKSPPTMWVDICKQNKDNLLYSVDKFKNELSMIEELITQNRWDEVSSWMQNANRLYKIFGSK